MGGSGSGTGDGSGATDPTLASGQELAPGSAKGAPDEVLAAGAMVGEYKIVRKLPKGAMGAVYEAIHPVIGKTAAVKVITRRLSGDPIAVQRFIQEARSVNQIGHVNIVDIFAFGELPDGRPYYVMEWLAGESLYERLRRGPMDPAEMIDVIEPVCDALEAAHDKGVVHRDLKPDNIFLEEMHGNRQLIKLLDFGIAKLHVEQATSPDPTQTGVVMGTPGYISPEQARGKAVDHRTDVYALGCMAFQMLTGRLPFPAESAMDMIALHLTQAAPRVSAQRPAVPEALDELIFRMMAKRADERPAIGEVRKLLLELRASLGEGTSTGSGRQTFRPKLHHTPPGISLNLQPGADPKGVEALMATAPVAMTPDSPSQSQPTFAPAPRHTPWLLILGVALAAGISAAIVVKASGSSGGSSPIARPPAPAPSPVPTPQPVPDRVQVPLPVFTAHGGTLTVQVDPAEARVLLDGKPLTVSGGAASAPITPGAAHVVVVEAPGYQSMQFDVQVAEGESMKVPIRLSRGRGKGKLTKLPAPIPEPVPAPVPVPVPIADPVPDPVPASAPDAGVRKGKKDKNYTLDPFGKLQPR